MMEKGKGKPVVAKREFHRVVRLYAAAGTGTFLAVVIKQIAPKVQGVAPGQWPSYVEKELIPRLHGFELLMASYAMCHMKLDMMLSEMGYKPTKNPPRLSVYLTNSLEEGERVNQSLPFAQWLSNEAKEANTIKRDMPIMCVIGNPPYSGISQNMGDWIVDLIEDYKYVDGEHFGERKHWLHDDYVKFIRLAEHLIEKNGEGVLGFITNHGYLDNPTFRGMRWHLLKSFDKIWVLDLHGNAKKKEVTPDGSPDKNVFDIQQGVALIIAMKKRHAKGTKKKLAAVWHGDLWGSRKEKYEALWNDSYTSVSKNLLDLPKPFFHFQSKCLERKSAYQDGFSLADMFGVFGLGFQTSRDDLVVAENKAYLIEKIEAFLSLSGGEGAVRERFFPKHKAGKYKKGDTRQWTLEGARQKLAGDQDWQNDIRPALYRPFDIRQVLYRKDMVDWPRPEVLGHMSHLNLALIANRQTKEEMGAFVACSLTERKIAAVYDASTTFPLYLYPDPNRPNYTEEGHLDETIRVNMDPKILRIIEEAAMGVMPEGDVMPSLDDEGKPDIIPCYGADGRPNEVAIFDYIYGVLHCPNYRETYKEFLKIDFPRIPYPPSPEIFRDVQDKGTQLRRLHLMEPEVIGETPYPFEGEGDGVVGQIDYKEGAVSINDDQYFANVPLIAWEFYIGGYQPAQKWLRIAKAASYPLMTFATTSASSKYCPKRTGS